MTRFFHFAPITSLELVKLGTLEFVYWLIQTNAWHITPKRDVFSVQSQVTSLNFQEKVIISRKWCTI